MEPLSFIVIMVTVLIVGAIGYSVLPGTERTDRAIAGLSKLDGVTSLSPIVSPAEDLREIFRGRHRATSLPGEGLLEPEDGPAVVGLRGELERRSVDMLFVLEPGSDDRVKLACVTAAVPGVSASALELWSVPVRMKDSALEYAPGWLDRRLRVGGTDYDALTFLTHELVEVLRDVAAELAHEADVGHADIIGRSDLRGRGAVSMRNGKLGFTMSFFDAPTYEKIESMLSRWIVLLGDALRVAPEPGPNYDTLVARARSEDEHIEARWRSVVSLGDRMGAAEHFVSLLGERADLPEEVVVALASTESRVLGHDAVSFEEAEHLAILARGIDLGGGLARCAAAEYARLDPWAAFIDERLDAALRAQSARRCLSSPSLPDGEDAREDAIVSALGQGRLGARLTAEAFEDLLAAGWLPSYDALARLAPRAKAPLAGAIIGWIVARGLTVEDASTLQALRDRGHGDRVERLLIQLKSEAGDRFAGQLSVSVAPDTHGAISSVEAGGTLTMSDEEPA